MGSCCCKDDVFDMKVRQRKQRVKEIYKKYSKKKCYICDNIKYGKNHKVVYGSEFICIDCDISRRNEEKRPLFKYNENASSNI